MRSVIDQSDDRLKMNRLLFRLIGRTLWYLKTIGNTSRCCYPTTCLEHSPADKRVVVAGGFIETTTVKSSDLTLNLSRLEGDHEEAETRLILHLHCIQWNQWWCQCVIHMSLSYCWLTMTKWDVHPFLFMKAGTSKHPRYSPVHEIRRQIPFDQVSVILASHAITGCYSVS